MPGAVPGGIGAPAGPTAAQPGDLTGGALPVDPTADGPGPADAAAAPAGQGPADAERLAAGADLAGDDPVGGEFGREVDLAPAPEDPGTRRAGAHHHARRGRRHDQRVRGQAARRRDRLGGQRPPRRAGRAGRRQPLPLAVSLPARPPTRPLVLLILVV